MHIGAAGGKHILDVQKIFGIPQIDNGNGVVAHTFIQRRHFFYRNRICPQHGYLTDIRTFSDRRVELGIDSLTGFITLVKHIAIVGYIEFIAFVAVYIIGFVRLFLKRADCGVVCRIRTCHVVAVFLARHEQQHRRNHTYHHNQYVSLVFFHNFCLSFIAKTSGQRKYCSPIIKNSL